MYALVVQYTTISVNSYFCFGFALIFLVYESKIQSHGFGYSFFLFILIFTVFTKMTRAYVKKEVLENFQKEKKRKEKKKKRENQNRPTPTLKSKKMFK